MEWIVQPSPFTDNTHIVTKDNKALSTVEGEESEGEVMEFIREVEAVEVARVLNKIIQW